MLSKLVTRKESKRYPGLYVRKYGKTVFFKNLWNKDASLVESRGHVEDVHGNLVVNPFTKVFNRFENGTDIDRDAQVIAIRKVNGFMACATWVPQVGEVVVSTTGSLDSKFCDMAREHLQYSGALDYIYRMKDLQRGTWIFEIVDKDDPHIVPEELGAYLLGYRGINSTAPYCTSELLENALDYSADFMGVLRPEWYIRKFSEVVQMAKHAEHEGYMVYDVVNKKALKIKSPYYLTLKLLARKKDVLSFNLEKVEEEFYSVIKYAQALGDKFNMLEEQDRLKLMRQYIERHC